MTAMPSHHLEVVSGQYLVTTLIDDQLSAHREVLANELPLERTDESWRW